MTYTTYTQLRNRLAIELSRDVQSGTAQVLACEPGSRCGDEKLLQAVWHYRLLRGTELTSVSGKRIEVIDPGRWNHGAGPDFLDAQVRIDGVELAGDIEIHVRASDWERHRHGRDFDYNRVVLHVFLESDDRATQDVLHNGRPIERVCLSGELLGDIESLQQVIELEDLAEPIPARAGACQQALMRLDAPFIRRFFDAAARERMERKIRRIAEWARNESADQVLYQTLLAGLGQKANRTLYFLLARRVTFEELRSVVAPLPASEVTLAVESILLHVAGLLSLPMQAATCSGPPLDAPTQEYLEALSRHWSRLCGYFQDRLMAPTSRWFAGIRPASFPQRRLAGLARLLVELNFRDGLAQAMRCLLSSSLARSPKSQREWSREIAALSATFSPDGASYWRQRFTLGGKPTRQPIKLIGNQTARHLVFNGILPFLLYDARHRHDQSAEEHLWRLHDLFPALEQNAVTRFMHNRVVKGLPAGSVDMRYERTQQALLHLFYDCCQGDLHDCSQCGLLGDAPAPPTG